ncbi:MAG: M3 family metallopeptidase [Rikenellaceae bacterium]|nr:M3 family metallopeptidase [Rikenellaceae bacterium]
MISKHIAVLLAAAIITGCTDMKNENPLLGHWDTPHNTVPFGSIKLEHYRPAVDALVIETQANIDAIADNPAAPDFGNTVEALEHASDRLGLACSVLFNLNSAHTSDSLQQIAMEVNETVTELGDRIHHNDKLFGRIKAVYDNRASLGLDEEQTMLLENTYKEFARGGALLSHEDKEELGRINKELGTLSLDFEKNILDATNDYTLHLTDKEELAGLPDYVVAAAAEEASERGKEGWVITLQAPSYGPFMQFSSRGDLREKLYRAYGSRCTEGTSHDNTAILKRIADLRRRKAALLGYDTYADYVLEERMAGNRRNVEEFLNELLDRSMPFARRDVRQVADYAASHGHSGEMMPWDFSYWSERLKNDRYSLSDSMLKPYFRLESVQEALFMLAGRLYGITFRENKEIEVWHPDVKAYEVFDADGSYLAVLYMDFFPRESKRGGAWMNPMKELTHMAGVDDRPHITVVTNVTKPTADSPSLLTFREVETLLHEFGHALHGIFAEGRYTSLSGTNVAWDFVELPSQIMENWATERDFLSLWAKDYRTGEVIPDSLINKIIESRNYLSGYASSRQLGFGIDDMAWHTVTAPVEESVAAFERKAIDKASVLPAVEGCYFSPSFSHVFAGGYAAGYYSYKWAEVLEADAYSLFKERGIYDKETAAAFRKLLSSGGRRPEMETYVEFRGHRPQIDALLEKTGLTGDASKM